MQFGKLGGSLDALCLLPFAQVNGAAPCSTLLKPLRVPPLFVGPMHHWSVWFVLTDMPAERAKAPVFERPTS